MLKETRKEKINRQNKGNLNNFEILILYGFYIGLIILIITI